MSKYSTSHWAVAALAGALSLPALAASAEPPSRGQDVQGEHSARTGKRERPRGLNKHKNGKAHGAVADDGVEAPEGGEGIGERAIDDKADRQRGRRGRPAFVIAAWQAGLRRARAATADAAAGGESGQTNDARAQRAAERKERAEAHRAELKKHLSALGRGGELDARITKELSHHAGRVAKLARIRALAESKQDTETSARVDKLLEREVGRHEAKLARLTGQQSSETATAEQGAGEEE